MTSSFGNVVGTPRDKLPDLGSTNYDRTAPDMTGVVNKEIDRSIADTKDFFNDMIKLAELRYKNRDDNLKALANFAKSAAEYKAASEKAEEVAVLRREDNQKIDDAQRQHEESKEREYDGEVTKGANNLIEQGDTNSIDMATIITKKSDEDFHIDQFRDPNWAAIDEYTNKNDWLNKGTSAEGEAVWDEGEDLWLVTLYGRYEKEGGDTKSNAWKKHMRKHILPELRKRKEKAMLEWEQVRKLKIRSNLNDRIEDRILEDIASGEEFNTGELIAYVNGANGFTKDEQALTYIVDFMYRELTNKTGRVTPAMADDFKSLFKFKVNGTTDKTTTLQDSNFGSNGSLSASLISRLDRGIQNSIVDPQEVFKKEAIRFETDVIDPLRDENGELSEMDQLNIGTQWTKQFPNDPLPQSLLTAGVKSHTGNSFGTSYGNYSVPGKADTLADYKTDLQDVVIAKYKESDIVYSRNNLPGADNRAIEKAYGDLKRRVEQSEKGNQGMDFATRVSTELEQVKVKLAKGDYDVKPPEFNTGTEQDSIAIAEYFKQAGNIKSANFAHPLEKNALETSRVALNDGNFAAAITPFWRNLAKKLGVPPEQLLRDRLVATGGIDEKTGKIVDDNDIYKLSKDDLHQLHRNPNAHTSIDVFYKVNPETGEKNSTVMLSAARVKKPDGLYYDDDYYTLSGQGIRKLPRKSKQTAADLINMGADNIGRYQLSNEELKEAFAFTGSGTKPVLEGLLAKEFDENSQSQVLALLWHIRLQKQNSIRGVEIDGDFSWRLSGLTNTEQAALEEFMPGLKDAPYTAKPHVLQEDVMAAIIDAPSKPVVTKVQPPKRKRTRR